MACRPQSPAWSGRRPVDLALWLLLGALQLGCQPGGRGSPNPERCGPIVPAGAQHPLATRVIDLAGRYDLIQVQTQPDGGKIQSGRLQLAPLDSIDRARAVGGAVRDLVGWLDPVEADSGWRAIVSSREPARAGVVLSGQHLRLGQARDLQGYREHLTITAVSPRGFWGWWRGERGMALLDEGLGERVPPEPAGYFCALRVPSD